MPEPQSQPFTLPEALSALDYLQRRGSLCTGCGYRLAEWENQMHSHCTDCKNPVYDYRKSFKKPNDLEKVLCNRVQEFIGRLIAGPAPVPTNGKPAGKPSGNPGKP